MLDDIRLLDNHINHTSAVGTQNYDAWQRIKKALADGQNKADNSARVPMPLFFDYQCLADQAGIPMDKAMSLYHRIERHQQP